MLRESNRVSFHDEVEITCKFDSTLLSYLYYDTVDLEFDSNFWSRTIRDYYGQEYEILKVDRDSVDFTAGKDGLSVTVFASVEFMEWPDFKRPERPPFGDTRTFRIDAHIENWDVIVDDVTEI
jgi:hypothetical protein